MGNYLPTSNNNENQNSPNNQNNNNNNRQNYQNGHQARSDSVNGQRYDATQPNGANLPNVSNLPNGEPIQTNGTPNLPNGAQSNSPQNGHALNQIYHRNGSQVLHGREPSIDGLSVAFTPSGRHPETDEEESGDEQRRLTEPRRLARVTSSLQW